MRCSLIYQLEVLLADLFDRMLVLLELDCNSDYWRIISVRAD
jgi:hypothetical protein